jgi:Protein of unknown function (DUF3097)
VTRWKPGHDVLTEPRRKKIEYPDVDARLGLVVEHRDSGFCGAIITMTGAGVTLQDRMSRERTFAWERGAFAIDGRPVSLVAPVPRGAGEPGGVGRTASGSIAVPGRPVARVARASRILVEGVHDAELVERVWGDDLRVEGVVVERLDGIDHLADVIAELRPGPDARLGVLVDHLVPGSKESRIAAAVAHPHVLVTGTPYVDVWQAIRPKVLGIEAWPRIPRDRSWKEGVIEALGLPNDPGRAWRVLLARVQTYADLEADLVGAVEQLIDFVCE